MRAPRNLRSRHPRWLAAAWLGFGLGFGLAAPAPAISPGASLDLETMTYVSSRGGEAEVVLSADHAEYRPDQDVVQLEGVRLRVAERAGVTGFELTCESGELQLEAGDFVARGDVRGRTREGRQLRTERLRYRHDQALVSTDQPVEIRDEAGTYRGGGFEYHVREARFRLLGGATLVQEP